MKIEHSGKRKDSNYMLVCIEYNAKEIEKAERVFDGLMSKNYQPVNFTPTPKGYIYIELNDRAKYDHLLATYKELKNKGVDKNEKY